MQRVKSWPGVPAAAVRSVLLIFFVPSLSLLFRLIFVHTLHLIQFTHLSKFLCNSNNNAVIAVCVAFADTHTRIADALGLFVCMHAYYAKFNFGAAALSLSLSLAQHSHSLSFVSAILATFFTFNFFLRKRSGASTAASVLHTHTHTHTDS